MASECAAGRSVVANAELFEQLLQAKLSNTKISVQVDAVRNERHNIEVLVLRIASDSASGSLELVYEQTESTASSTAPQGEEDIL
jgi:hypothetical protein